MTCELTIGSLFAGVGGLELGLEQAGLGPVVWQAESDAFARRILAWHWPHARRYQDVREVRSDSERPEIICGGFPCQDISLAGLGAGLKGARSGLWREFARVIRDLRPRYVVVENVAALVNRGLDAVLGELATLGYDAWWDCIPAAAVGAPHRRDRLFVVAWRVSDAECDGLRDQPERRNGSAREADGGNAEPVDVGAPMGDTDGSRQEGTGSASRAVVGSSAILAHSHSHRRESERRGEVQHGERTARRNHADRPHLPQWPPGPGEMHLWEEMPPEAQPALRRCFDGLRSGLDWILGRGHGKYSYAALRRRALKAYGNAVVPPVAAVIGDVIIALEEARLENARKGTLK